MIGYVSVGTNDIERAAAFFDALLSELGGKRLMEFGPGFIVWGSSFNAPMLALAKPYDKKPATVGNGTMVALAASSKEQVDAIYKKAMELGATDEGAPGPRGEQGNFYAAYFRDLDGNKFNAFYISQ
ncbi:VOC family protein [Haliangium sp.]|uniref:VOC family protein n=1 Tax=Haliangium sp. TaxID=2663208 RepID=UPI003D0F67D8